MYFNVNVILPEKHR